ncbi:MAG: hypothetical protein L0220_14730 [Acidobacteria bacterium]|nr:hypothetical protein [Acidobacteriota bacterium]
MKESVIAILLVIGVILSGFSKTPGAQTKNVKVRFEVDGKVVVKPNYSILIEVDGRQIEPVYTKTGFVVPNELSSGQEIKLKFKSGEYDLDFSSLKSTHFDTEWIVGVDIPPLNISVDTPESDKRKKLVMVYYIKFRPLVGEGTTWITKIYQ